MANNFGDYFADAFTKAQETSAKIKYERQKDAEELAFKRWQTEQQGDQIKQVYGITPEGGLGVIGAVPKGSQVMPASALETPEQKSARELKLAADKNLLPTADMKNALVTTKQSRSLVDNLIKQSESLRGGWEGVGELGKMTVNRGKGDSAKYKTYVDTMPATAVSIYRAVTGDTRLSDSDAQARAYPLMWHPSEDVDVRKQKNEYIKSMVLAREALLSSGKFTSGEKGDAITDLGSVSAMAEKILAAKKAGYTDDEITAYYGGKNGK